MKTALTILLLSTLPAAAQETTTLHFDYSDGLPVVVKQESRDYGYIFIKRGDKAVLEMGPPDYYYGRGWSGHRSHYYYGRSYREYNRGR